MRRALVLTALLALLCAGLARADGDPASDYLLGQATFVPPDIGVPQAYANQLAQTVQEAKARGYTIRVALIGSKYDMGSVIVLYRKPKQYARFLGEELSFVYKGRLLVVMPNGLAVSRNGKAQPREQAVVDRMRAPGNTGTAIAQAATSAVVKLAANAGIVVPQASLSGSRAGSGSTTTQDRITIAAVALVAALAVGGFVLYRRRRAVAG